MGNLTHEDKDGWRLYRYELGRAEALLIKSRRSLELVTKEHARALEQEAERLEAQAAELREESAQALAALADEDQEGVGMIDLGAEYAAQNPALSIEEALDYARTAIPDHAAERVEALPAGSAGHFATQCGGGADHDAAR